MADAVGPPEPDDLRNGSPEKDLPIAPANCGAAQPAGPQPPGWWCHDRGWEVV